MSNQRRSIVLNGTRVHFSIAPEQVASAITKVRRYSIAEKVRRVDDVSVAQPALLGAAAQLLVFGVAPPLVDHAFQVLLILFECFSENVPQLAEINHDTVQTAFDDLAAIAGLGDTTSTPEACAMKANWLGEQGEPVVSAFVVDYLKTRLPDLTRDQELVRNCCLAMLNAYLAAYKKHQSTNSTS